MGRASIQSLRPEFTAAQLAALSKPFAAGATAFDDGRDEFLPPGCTAIVTCDVDPESMEYFGGPVWHAVVYPPNREHAAALLDGVGEGVLFEGGGGRADLYHLRRRMTPREIMRLGDAVTASIKGVMR